MNIKIMQNILDKSPYCQKLIKEGADFSEEMVKRLDAGECSCSETYLCLMCAVRMKIVYTQPDPEMQAIADEATEQEVLANAARIERWRVAREGDDWFAEKPCTGCNGTGTVADSCPDEQPGCCVAHFRTHRKCGGRGWVRIGVPHQPAVFSGMAPTGATITVTDPSGGEHV